MVNATLEEICGRIYSYILPRLPWRPREIKIWQLSDVKLWQPEERVESFEEIDIDRLYNNGIHVFVLDVDGNITTFHGGEVNENIKEKIQYTRNKGIEVWVLSNCDEVRENYLINYFGNSIEMVIGRANKPSPTKLLAVMQERNKVRKEMGEKSINPENVAVIGDQYSTDIQLGNLIGAYTIKVDNTWLARTEPVIKQIQRRVEEWLYRRTFPNT